MQFIGETQNRNVNFLLLPFNYTQMYNKLTTLLSTEDVRCLAKPDMISGTTAWTAVCGKEARIVAFESLSDEQKDELADRLEVLKQNIITKLAGVKEMQPILTHLFTVPSTSDVKAIVDQNMVYPLLLQWGCTSNEVNSSADPITSLINRPRTNSAYVDISFVYHTGEPASLIPFKLHYRNLETDCHTDSAGNYVLGRCKLQTHFAVQYSTDGFSRRYDFEVTNGAAYQVTIFKMAERGLRVIDQHGQPVPNTPVILRTDTEQTIQTDATGCASLGSWKVGDTLTVIDAIDPTNQTTDQVTAENTMLTLKVVRYQRATCKVHVVDEHRNPVVGFALDLAYNTIQENRYTNDFGLIGLTDNLYVGNTLTITNPKNPANQQAFILEHPENEIEFVLYSLPPEFVTFKLVDKKKNPLQQVAFDILIQGKKHSLVSDDQGVCMLPKEMFKDGEWLKADFKISSKELRKRLKAKK